MREKQQAPDKAHGGEPQRSRLFRFVSFITHIQLGYLLRDGRHPKMAVRLFVFIEAVSALAIISTTAYLIDLPLLFPPLGPSAFILFFTPLARTAAPRSVLLAHSMGLFVGLAMVGLFSLLFPDAALSPGDSLNWARIATLSLAMGVASLGMILFHCEHPPAAATTLIAAMGFIDSHTQVFGYLVAVLLLILQAIIFNRMMGGLPFPLWNFSPEAARQYPDLAGLSDREITSRDKIQERIFRRQK
ncbi:MAG: HPP family protein [Candidatus Sedimenticola sp. (ex Thyasira tokunagai)]